ncbi:proline-rich protein 36-like [Macrobrachium rosenbergii]|uniref:proline-rich protein 36-like n=1 Tax=Macrobrachium rosenbergii TaxID=79674 RepID=UPI0034D55FD1
MAQPLAGHQPRPQVQVGTLFRSQVQASHGWPNGPPLPGPSTSSAPRYNLSMGERPPVPNRWLPPASTTSQVKALSSLPGPSFPWLANGLRPPQPLAGHQPRPQVQVEALSSRSQVQASHGWRAASVPTAGRPPASATSQVEALSSAPQVQASHGFGERPAPPTTGRPPASATSPSRGTFFRSQVQASHGWRAASVPQPLAGHQPRPQVQVEALSSLPGPIFGWLPGPKASTMAGKRSFLPLPGPHGWQPLAATSLGHKSSRGTFFRFPGPSFPWLASNGLRLPPTAGGHQPATSPSRGTLFRFPGPSFPWLANGQPLAATSPPASGHKSKSAALSSTTGSQVQASYGWRTASGPPTAGGPTSLSHKSKSRHSSASSFPWLPGPSFPWLASTLFRLPGTKLPMAGHCGPPTAGRPPASATSPSRGTFFRSQVQASHGWRTASGPQRWRPPASTQAKSRPLFAPRSKLPMAGGGLGPPNRWPASPPAPRSTMAGHQPRPQVQVEALSSAPRSKLPSPRVAAGPSGLATSPSRSLPPTAGWPAAPPPRPPPSPSRGTLFSQVQSMARRPQAPWLAATAGRPQVKSWHSLLLPGPWVQASLGPQPLAGHQPSRSPSRGTFFRLPGPSFHGWRTACGPPTTGRPPASATSPSRGTFFRSQVQASHGWRAASGPQPLAAHQPRPKSKSWHFLRSGPSFPWLASGLRPPTTGRPPASATSPSRGTFFRSQVQASHGWRTASGPPTADHQPRPKSKSRHWLRWLASQPRLWPTLPSPSRGTFFRSQVQASHGWRTASGPQPLAGHQPRPQVQVEALSSAPRTKLPHGPGPPQPLAATSLGHKSSRGTSLPLPGPSFPWLASGLPASPQVQVGALSSAKLPMANACPPNRWPATSLGHKSSRGTFSSLPGPSPMVGLGPQTLAATSLSHKSSEALSSAPRSKLPMAGATSLGPSQVGHFPTGSHGPPHQQPHQPQVKWRHSLGFLPKLPMAGERPHGPQPLAATSLGHKSSRGTFFRSQVQASHGWRSQSPQAGGPIGLSSRGTFFRSQPSLAWLAERPPASATKSSRGSLFRSQVQASQWASGLGPPNPRHR